MKPKNWKELPESLLREFLWDIKNLDYSHHTDQPIAKTISGIVKGKISDINKVIVDKAWKNLSDQQYEDIILLNIIRATKASYDENGNVVTPENFHRITSFDYKGNLDSIAWKTSNPFDSMPLRIITDIGCKCDTNSKIAYFRPNRELLLKNYFGNLNKK